MCRKLMFPVPGERRAKRQPVALGIDGQFLLQHLSKMLLYASIEFLDIRGRILSISKLKKSGRQGLFALGGGRGRGVRRVLTLLHLPNTSAVLSRRPAATSLSIVFESFNRRSVRLPSARITSVARID